VQQSVRTVVAIVTEIGAEDSICFGLQLTEQMMRGQLITGASKIGPETFRQTRAVHLRCEHRESLLPLRQCRGTISLLVVGEGKTVIHLGTVRRKFEGVIVVGDGVLRVARVGVIVGKGQVSGSARRTLFENGRKEILRVAQFCGSQIFAVARSIVEPNATGELLGAIDGPGEPHTDGIIAKSGEERVVHLRSRLGEIKSDERVVGLIPDCGASLSASLHHGVRQSRTAVRDHIVRGQFTVGHRPD